MNADARRPMQTHTDARRQTQTNARQTTSVVWADPTSRRVQMLDVCSRTFGTLKTYRLHKTDVHSVHIYIYIYTYMKNPQFDSLVWGSLILAPNTIRIKFEIQKLTVRLAVKM